MLNISFVIPTWHYFENPFKLQPLYELYYATVIDEYFADGKNQINVSIIDRRELRRGVNIDEIEKDADIYIYWIMKAADYNEIVEFVKKKKKSNKYVKHIAGGTHISVTCEESVAIFDVIIKNAGEEALIVAIQDFINNKMESIYDFSWSMSNYDRYPFPKRAFLPENAIVNAELFEKYDHQRGTSVMFSRGCNFKCSYCAYNVPNQIQRRTCIQIKDEIAYLKKEYKLKAINMRDEICIPLKDSEAIPYLNTLGECDIIWRGQTRIGSSEKSIKLAAKTGCKELSVGVESADQEVLRICSKGHTVGQAKEFINKCKEEDIKIKMCLILGLPGEKSDILEKTIKFIEDVKPDYVNISGFCPVPGSRIFNDYKKFGIKNIDMNYDKHAHLMLRYKDDEDFGLPFEYEQFNEDGTRNLSRKEIYENILELQKFCRENDMLY